MDNIEHISFSSIAEVNPHVSITHLTNNMPVSFIPMSDVTETGQWINHQERKLEDLLRHGYTPFQEGDILFAKITPCMENGKGSHAIGLANGIGFGTTEFHVLRAKPGGNNRFIYHWLQSDLLRLKAEALMIGSAGQRRVSPKFFDIYAIPPLSLPEQYRIANILDAIDEQIQHTDQLITKLKHLRDGLLHKLLSFGIDEHGQLRDPVAHPELFKDTAEGKIPKEWQIDNLLNHISLPQGQVDPKISPFNEWPLIAPDHIEPRSGRLINIQTAAQQKAISGKYTFSPGDVLYCKIRPYLRKAVLADREGLCSADMYPLCPKDNMDPHFLLVTILGERFSKFATAVSMRSGFPKINRNELSEFTLLLPPYQEQKVIANIVLSLDTNIYTEEVYYSKLKLYKIGLTHDLLTGKVRISGKQEVES